MKFSQATITAIVALSSLIGATEPHRRRRSLEAKNSKPATQTNQNTTASVLAAQTGTDCFLTPTVTGVYTLVVTNINPVTTLFEERPGRRAGTRSTANFTATFAATFGTDLPNAAVTIRDGTGHHDNIVFIVTLSDPSMSDEVVGRRRSLDAKNSNTATTNHSVVGGGITYTVAQSSSQAGVLSLDSVYEGQDTSSDNSCSIFIDGMSNDACVVSHLGCDSRRKYSR